MVAGMTRIPFGKYIAINFLGQFFWTGILLGVGYFLGDLYTQASSIFGKMSIFALFVLVLLALNGYRKYMSNKITAAKI